MKKVLLTLFVIAIVAGCSNDTDESSKKKEKEDNTPKTSENDKKEDTTQSGNEEEGSEQVVGKEPLQAELEIGMKHKKYDEFAKEYFQAWLVSDYDALRKHMSDKAYKENMSIIESMGFKGATKPGQILNPEYEDMVGEKYKFMASDYYLEDHNLILYYIEYDSPLVAEKEDLKDIFFGVTKQDGKLTEVGNAGALTREFFKKENLGSKRLVDGLVEMFIEKHPESAYIIHEYEK